MAGRADGWRSLAASMAASLRVWTVSTDRPSRAISSSSWGWETTASFYWTCFQVCRFSAECMVWWLTPYSLARALTVTFWRLPSTRTNEPFSYVFRAARTVASVSLAAWWFLPCLAAMIFPLLGGTAVFTGMVSRFDPPAARHPKHAAGGLPLDPEGSNTGEQAPAQRQPSQRRSRGVEPGDGPSRPNYWVRRPHRVLQLTSASPGE